MHHFDEFEDKNKSDDKKKEIDETDILTSSVKENLQVMFNNENVFKIVVIMISCLNKLHHAGNLNKLYITYDKEILFLTIIVL